MGKQTKHAALNKKSNNSDNPNRPTDGKGGLRSKSTIMRLNMYKRGKPVRNKDGKVIGGSLLMSNTSGGKEIQNVARIAPDRKWFGNTRILSQRELDNFREEMTTKEADPYSVILRRKKIPMALLQESQKISTVNLLESESYDSVFGSKNTRKRPKINGSVIDYESLLLNAAASGKTYDLDPSKDSNIEIEATRECDLRKDDLFAKGQSKRIWSELYKVLDCSDVVLQIVDARNVPGTRCQHIENHIKKNASHKHMIIVINKCDLVPNWVTRKWVKILSATFPTLAFHASITNSFGKGALISLLRQFGKLHADKRQISVGVIGYPNTGKSSVINSLVGKPCCKAAPVPGETKVWQYITLMRRIFLIDSPGIVYDNGDDETATVLKGAVRAERLDNPQDFIGPILERVKKEHIQKKYNIQEWTDSADFLHQLAILKGKLRKGGEPDTLGVAKSMINDWQRGKLPFFVPPPRSEGDEDDNADLGDDEPAAMDLDDEDSEDDAEGENEDDVVDSGEDDDAMEQDDDDEEEESEEEEEVVVPVKSNARPTKSSKGKKATATSQQQPGQSHYDASWEEEETPAGKHVGASWDGI